MNAWRYLSSHLSFLTLSRAFYGVGVTILLIALVSALVTPRLAWSGEAQDRSQELLAQGWQEFDKHAPANYATVLELFTEAKEADPANTQVDAALAALYWRSYQEFWFNVLNVSRSDARLKAKRHLEAALRSPTTLAYQVDCRMKAFNATHDEALAACTQAIDLDPEDAEARHAMALALIYAGQPEKALLQIKEARRLDPRMEDYHGYYEGMARFFAGDSEGAVPALETAMSANPELWSYEHEDHFNWAVCLPCVVRIAALGDLGREEAARQAVKAFMKRHIEWTVTNELFWWPLKREQDTERLSRGLRRAGVPE